MVTTRTARARELRAQATDCERYLWGRLRARRLDGERWRRQAPIGPFFVDFACFSRRLIVEIDGSQHRDRLLYDKARSRWLESHGWIVLRFWNGDVLHDLDGVCAAIVATNPWPSPAPPSPLATGLASSPKGEEDHVWPPYD
ncbi:MAG: DUF559 domain-containing protein [Caulobacter sp.]|nr:DUF559 domain-containing protein [Caulobacter sp.]